MNVVPENIIKKCPVCGYTIFHLGGSKKHDLQEFECDECKLGFKIIGLENDDEI